uniref:ZAD domain-containing protein n=1 Tax=Bactrocera latifrons TaxID=174628 RepID=A0A0K8VI83_BACLA
MRTDVVTMQYCCFACLQELPPNTTVQNSKSLQNLQWNKDLAKTYHKKTGIVINYINEYSKQVCQNCYNKLRAFDSFCETALDCSTALSELLLEEDFSLKTLKNLQHFCSTCLCQINEINDSLHLNNKKVKRWLHEYNKLKMRTGTEHWPNSFCQQCCNKIDEFLQFHYTAKQSFKQLNKTSNQQQSNVGNTSKGE